MTNKVKIYLYNEKRFFKTLYGLEYFKYIFDYLKYRKNIVSGTMAKPNALYSYKVPMENIKIKSPSLRLLKLMKMRYFNECYLNQRKQYFYAIGLSNTSTIVDIGANIGYYSLIYSLIFPGSNIYSFEPSALNFSYLKYHADQRENISIFNYGLHDKEEVLTIQMPSEEQSASVVDAKNNTGLLSLYGSSGRVKERVNLFTLDEKVLKEKIIKKQISFIKIDVEGNELKVLMGATGILEMHKPILEIELNKSALLMAGTTPENIVKFMKKIDYQPYIYADEKIQIMPKEINPIQNIIFMPE
jgi:FkbM family methyltransferase